jgi:AbrB family looped-hinge helix DNA binding protein
MHPNKIHFFGSNTIGEKGQVVIPVEGRHALDMNPGDKLIFLGDEEKGILIVSKAGVIEQHMADLQANFESMREQLNGKDE